MIASLSSIMPELASIVSKSLVNGQDGLFSKVCRGRKIGFTCSKTNYFFTFPFLFNAWVVMAKVWEGLIFFTLSEIVIFCLSCKIKTFETFVPGTSVLFLDIINPIDALFLLLSSNNYSFFSVKSVNI